MQTVGEALSDPQTLSRGLIVEIDHPTLAKARSIANPVRLAAQPVVYRWPPPLLGEHNRQILSELRLSESELERALGTACKNGV
jgi:crotonobetainyl-CoA:carnitine CoA-transferase CaiB-like acyl-CoA transferase